MNPGPSYVYKFTNSLNCLISNIEANLLVSILVIHNSAFQAELEEDLIRRMKTVFTRHGAVVMGSKLMGYNTGKIQANEALLLDQSCSVLALRHEMRLPFAMWLSRQVFIHLIPFFCTQI